jgi:hypothetical protein
MRDEVTFERFCEEYAEELLKNCWRSGTCDEFTMYKEILLIKGGRIVNSDEGRAAGKAGGPNTSTSSSSKKPSRKKTSVLSRDEYVSAFTRPRESAKHFGEEERKTMYACYQRYQLMLADRACWDVADACNDIFERWSRFGHSGRVVTSVQIDETQDLLVRQIKMVNCLAKDPSAFSFAADTAQAIERGSGVAFCRKGDFVVENFH